MQQSVDEVMMASTILLIQDPVKLFFGLQLTDTFFLEERRYYKKSILSKLPRPSVLLVQNERAIPPRPALPQSWRRESYF